MGALLRRFQLVRKCSLLLAEILFRRIAGTQTALKLGLRGFQLVDCRGLSGELPPKIRDHLVALSNFRSRDLPVVACIAQFFLNRSLSRAQHRLTWLWSWRC